MRGGRHDVRISELCQRSGLIWRVHVRPVPRASLLTKRRSPMARPPRAKLWVDCCSAVAGWTAFGAESGGSSGVPDALSRELDYDVALITLARLLGVDSDIESFDQPQKERSRLEQALVDHGIRLDELEGNVDRDQ